MSEITEELRKALEKASTQHEWDTDGRFIQWKDGHPLKGTYRQIAITHAPVPEMFNNENYENDAYLLANAPTWLRTLLEENERLTKERDEEKRHAALGWEQSNKWLEENGRLRAELDQLKKYIGFLQSCTRSGEGWNGTFDDFKAKKGDTNGS